MVTIFSFTACEEKWEVLNITAAAAKPQQENPGTVQGETKYKTGNVFIA
jgi:hypothetical protein